jgi:hypothetical protein
MVLWRFFENVETRFIASLPRHGEKRPHVRYINITPDRVPNPVGGSL